MGIFEWIGDKFDRLFGLKPKIVVHVESNDLNAWLREEARRRELYSWSTWRAPEIVDVTDALWRLWMAEIKLELAATSFALAVLFALDDKVAVSRS